MFAALMKWMQTQKVLPQISDSERQALEAGDVWIDGEFFGGNPDFGRMLRHGYHRLSAEEQAFLDGPVEELLRIADCHAIAHSRQVPDEVFEYMRREGFFGLIVPKEYGGKGFSTLARSSVMAKITPHSGTLSALIVIPNTLGAAELILEYGTVEQKRHYLPRLARGELLPCFALTEPGAGSDAASIQAEGEVFRDAGGEVQLRLNFRKRFITLAPIANLISLACHLHDPGNLLGKGPRPGITVVLVPGGTPGLVQGERHEPIGEAFPNGPLLGRNVVVPAHHIVGGAERAGEGWKMLMESLAGGRMVSLPAAAVGGVRFAAMTAGAYARVRRQFGMPIGQMEGVQERIARLEAMAYLLEGARVFGCSAVDDGIHPPVVSAVMKAYATELARQGASDAMDVFAGAGVMQGPGNPIGRLYGSAPVAVTVEGANIMTRTLMIFGQGATRSHPYAYRLVQAVERGDAAAFRKLLLGWLGQFFGGALRSLARGLTRGWTVRVPAVAPATRIYYRRLGWAAARFGWLANLALFCLGGRLKARGALTGRYADALAWMLLGFAALRRFEAEGRRAEDLPLLHYALRHALAETQRAFEAIGQNFDGAMGRVLRAIGAPWLALNPLARPPDDALVRQVAQIAQRDDAQARRLREGVHVPTQVHKPGGRLVQALRAAQAAQPALETIRRQQRIRWLDRGDPETLAAQACERGVIGNEELRLIHAARDARFAAIEVDVFAPTEFFADASADSSARRGLAEVA